MDSTSLDTFGFSLWLPFNKANSAVLIAGAPPAFGVSILRARSAASRLRSLRSPDNHDATNSWRVPVTSVQLRCSYVPLPILARCFDSQTCRARAWRAPRSRRRVNPQVAHRPGVLASMANGRALVAA
jgi:hypothetical protein